MTRTEAIKTITERLPLLDDARVLAIADFVDIMQADQTSPVRRLSSREQALLAQSKADFAAGRTYSHDEMVALIADDLARLGVPRSTA